MKFFLVISIIAFWWVPMNSPGNIGIPVLPMSSEFAASGKKDYTPSSELGTPSTKRKMDHFGDHQRKQMLRIKRKPNGGKLSKPNGGYSR